MFEIHGAGTNGPCAITGSPEVTGNDSTSDGQQAATGRRTPGSDELPASELEQRDDADLLDMIRSLPREHPIRETACEVLVNRYRPLVRSCVRRFQNSPEPYEDLLQVGYVGLIKAINNYDPAAGTGLAGYALPCVSGEIKRYFRDKRWQIHVKRSLQELRLAREERHGRAHPGARVTRRPKPNSPSG